MTGPYGILPRSTESCLEVPQLRALLFVQDGYLNLVLDAGPGIVMILQATTTPCGAGLLWLMYSPTRKPEKIEKVTSREDFLYDGLEIWQEKKKGVIARFIGV